jgi:hypothetical protein
MMNGIFLILKTFVTLSCYTLNRSVIRLVNSGMFTILAKTPASNGQSSA